MQVISAYTQLNDIVQQYGRKIHLVTPSHQAFCDQMYHIQMCAALVMQISNNLKKYQSFYIGRNLYHEHVTSMYKNDIWDTQLELQAAADCIRLSI